ncbi:VOC family protein [Plastoroseomonas hellenica]|nr:VOC family protein [Plastoroseomonas hellenica]
MRGESTDPAPNRGNGREGMMAVIRVVANIATPDVGKARAFYEDLLGMRVVMDHGWIVTFAAEGSARPQVSVAREGGSGTAVPDLSIEVDDLDAVHRRALAQGLAIEYGPVREPWGVRRFYLRDPFGRLINILVHDAGG